MWYAAQISEHSKVINKVKVQDPEFPDDPHAFIVQEYPSSSWVIRITPYAKALGLQPGMAVYCEFLPSQVFDDIGHIPEAIEEYRQYAFENIDFVDFHKRTMPRYPVRTVRIVREHGKKVSQPAALAISCKKVCRLLLLKPGDWISVRILGVVIDIEDQTHQTQDGKTYHRKEYLPDPAFYRFQDFRCRPVPVLPEDAPESSSDSSSTVEEAEDLDDLRRSSVVWIM